MPAEVKPRKRVKRQGKAKIVKIGGVSPGLPPITGEDKLILKKDHPMKGQGKRKRPTGGFTLAKVTKLMTEGASAGSNEQKNVWSAIMTIAKALVGCHYSKGETVEYDTFKITPLAATIGIGCKIAYKLAISSGAETSETQALRKALEISVGKLKPPKTATNFSGEINNAIIAASKYYGNLTSTTTSIDDIINKRVNEINIAIENLGVTPKGSTQGALTKTRSSSFSDFF
jgi:hypothetical protein